MSTIIIDTITGKSTATTVTIGSTPVVSASANSMTIRGEGTAHTSIQQGLCKAWVSWNASSIIDSFNISSVTDNATGAFTTVLASNMANATYSESGIGRGYHINTHTDNAKSTTGDKHQTFYVSGTGGQRTSLDFDRSEVNYHGDLA